MAQNINVVLGYKEFNNLQDPHINAKQEIIKMVFSLTYNSWGHNPKDLALFWE